MIRHSRPRSEVRAAAKRDARPARVVAALLLLTAAIALLLLGAEARAAEDKVKMIDEITIEGEVRLPRVLFITARQAERPLDFLDHYAVDPADVLGPAPAPGPIPALADPGAAPDKHAAVPAAAEIPVSPQAPPTVAPAEEVRP